MSETLRRLPRIRVLMWTKQARTSILDEVTSLLPVELQVYQESLESIIDELSKNAIKANHKYLMIRSRIRDFLRDPNRSPRIINEMTNSICTDAVQYNEFLEKHPKILEGLSAPLRRILDQEALWINLKMKYRTEKKEISEKEKTLLRNTYEFKKNYRELKDKRIYVEIRASCNDQMLWVEIINAAPILSSDLDRIYSKRDEFRKHREAGTELEFFMNNMDHSEGGSGLGYATIDTHLASLGLEPMEALYILSLHNTNIVLNLDLNKMKKALPQPRAAS